MNKIKITNLSRIICEDYEEGILIKWEKKVKRVINMNKIKIIKLPKL